MNKLKTQILRNMMNKRILFDVTATQPIGNVKFHGGGKYGVVVLKKLIALSPCKIAVFLNDKLPVDEELSFLFKKHKIPVYTTSKSDIIQAARQEARVVYTSLYGKRLASQAPDVTFIATFHGLRALEMPGDKYEKFYLDKGSVKCSFLKALKDILSSLPYFAHYRYNRSIRALQVKLKDENLRFVTVSEHSKSSLLTFMPFLKAEDIKVFYSPSTINLNLSIENYKNAFGKYYLIVSGNRWLKNGIRAIIALDQLFSEHPDWNGKVVITGLKKSSDVAIHIANKERFVFMGYVDEATLKGLYHYAYILIYPSLNEGFGYPPLEAMYEGCPVIASAVASIPEVCGDAVLYFNPYLIAEIKMRIIQMEDVHIRQYYALKGKKRQQEIAEKQNGDTEKLCRYLLSYIQ